MAEQRPPFYLITGLVLGFVLGLLYSWVWVPVETIGTQPITLQDSYKDEIRELIAGAYISSGDLGRAQARLGLLGDNDPARTLAVLAQRTLGEKGEENTARALGVLSAHLSGEISGLPPGEGSAVQPGDGTGTPAPGSDGSASPTATLSPAQTTTPTMTPTLLATRTPTPTQGAPFEPVDFFKVCDPTILTPVIQVYVADAANRAVPGVEVIVTWEGEQDHFYTGLKPEFGLGYADFEMLPEVEYTVRLAGGGKPVTELTAEDCVAVDGSLYYGSWRVSFRQP